MFAQCLNASAYLPRVRAKIDALTLATRKRPATHLEAKARQLLLGLQVILKEYCAAAFGIGVLSSQDPTNWKN